MANASKAYVFCPYFVSQKGMLLLKDNLNGKYTHLKGFQFNQNFVTVFKPLDRLAGDTQQAWPSGEDLLGSERSHHAE